ncbi:MAG: helix-turn-helix transcriptional regulator [Bacteroidota bacterium]
MSNATSELVTTIGLPMRKIRTLNELSQNQFAFESGLSREFINKVEGGKLNISILKLEKIAQVLNVDV